MWHKLAMIGLAFTLPLATATYLLMVENGRRIEFSENELRGMDYLRPLTTLLVDLSAHRTLSRQFLAGERPEADLKARSEKVDADFAALLEADARLGSQLRTTNADLNINATPAAQADRWKTWRTGQPDEAASDAAHTMMIGNVRTLINYVGVTSNLVLDPELRTYNLADALVTHGPELADRISRLGDTVDGLLVDARITLQDRTAVAATVATLTQHVDGLQEDLFTTFREGDDGLQQALGPLLHDTYLAVTDLGTATTRGFVDAGTVELDRAEYQQGVTRAVDSLAKLTDRLFEQERQLLKARLDGHARDRALALAAVLATLAVTVLLTVWQSRRITGDVGTVARGAAELAKGDLTGRVQVRSKDEIGAMAGAFNSMAERLQVMVEEQRASETELREAKERFQQAFDNASIGMSLVDLDTKLTQVNRALCDMLGRTEAELIGSSFADFTHPDDVEASMSAATAMIADHHVGPFRMEKRYLHSDGRTVWTVMTACMVAAEDGEPLYFVTQAEDITERRQAEAQLVRQALHDPLTGLPNRILLLDRLRQVLARSERQHQLTAVLFIDLDGFKDVNDSLGHDVGDEVLREVGRRLQHHVRPFDTVARLGGDEFVVLCQDLRQEQNVIEISERLARTLASPVVVDSFEVVVTASVGIALANGDAPTPEDLLRDADAAMYGAKARGKNRCEIFDEALRERSIDRIAITAALRQGLRDDRFVLHYQPVVDVITGAPVAVESLVRLNDPKRGMLAPGEFIQVAEDSGLIVPIGTSVLGQACRQLAAWRASGEVEPGMRTAVNLSARQATRRDLVDVVTAALAESGLEPSALALELTETAIMEADAATLRQLEEIRDMGVRLGIDDFGTGYSSLSYLKRLPVSFVKVDRSFVAGLVNDPSDREIVTAVIRLGQALGLTTIAEGVEEPAQFALLRDLGCDQAQGYLLGRPQAEPPARLQPTAR
ncbi:EAL domain-containing protein [Lentzea tibetensis]|uniref:EAL domain-containing protein n=1 Tax=Lentzea tibetensis TaxID=2591470 RepID=A0A563ESW7_9PSEU|nr:EAL domain-containing protein [Lentzea tibetensis]TWP50628.1 EAL domain-containing protein [Lentzea tibetensis]